jgi:RimJ/RimL family protein N-acetyltransferase
MDNIRVYLLRPVSADDEHLLFELYSSTRAEEMALVPWDAPMKDAFLRSQFSAQQAHYRSYFPEARHEIILVNDRPVGRIYVNRLDTKIHILDITLLPQMRSHGIGTQVLADLMKEASDKDQPLSIYVESYNRSLGLFQRLGFVKKDEAGFSWLMGWRAGS